MVAVIFTVDRMQMPSANTNEWA